MQRSSLIPLQPINATKTLSEQTLFSLPPISKDKVPSSNSQLTKLSQRPASELATKSIPVSEKINLEMPQMQNFNSEQNSLVPNSISSSVSNSYIPNFTPNSVPNSYIPKSTTNIVKKQCMEESLMKMGNRLPEIEMKNPTNEFTERNAALPINTSLSRVKSSPSTAEFSTFQGVEQNQDIEKALLERGFIPTEKILTKDENGNVTCRFIKARDNLGHEMYVELDTTEKDGMGYLTVSDCDNVLTLSKEASVIPYSLKVGSFEASNSSLFGVGFECDNQVCIMSRKDNSLEPIETVFSFSKDSDNNMGVIDHHPVPFPIVKLSEILANPKAVLHNVQASHSRMRNVAFNSCMKDVLGMKKNSLALQHEIERFDKIAVDTSNVLTCTITELENLHNKYEKHGTKCQKDIDNLRSVRFNLAKRNELTVDFISLCHSMRERSQRIAVLSEELRSLNDYAETLFNGISHVLTE